MLSDRPGMSAVIVRHFVPGDREAVRRICCETADRGGPVEHFFPDRDIFADVLLRYYLDDEPQSSWIAEADGAVVGYLTGCLDSRRCRRVMAWRVVPRAVLKVLARGTLGHPQTRALLKAGAATWWHGGFAGDAALRAYPAHLHVNVLAGFRGQAIGQELVQRFCDQVATAHLSGVHAVVREDNPPACAFFERLGFARVSRHPTTLITGRPHDTVIYGKRINP